MTRIRFGSKYGLSQRSRSKYLNSGCMGCEATISDMF